MSYSLYAHTTATTTFDAAYVGGSTDAVSVWRNGTSRFIG